MKPLIEPLLDIFDSTGPAGQEKQPFRLPRRSKKHREKPMKGDCGNCGGDSGRVHTFTQSQDKKELTGKAARQQQFLIAYRKNLFNLSDAARQSGVSRSTIYGWKLEDDFLERFNDAKEEEMDFIQAKLYEKIESGDTACTIFACKCLLQSRGFLPDKLMELSINSGETSSIRLSKADRDAVVQASMITPESIGLDFSKPKGPGH